MKKTLVAFFSASGTTKKIAEMIAEAANADLHEIAPKVLYTKDDLNWMNKKSGRKSQILIWIWNPTMRLFLVFQSGGMLHRPSSIHFWKSMISQAGKLFCLQLQAEAVLEIQ